jgi:hypothetical protein
VPPPWKNNFRQIDTGQKSGEDAGVGGDGDGGKRGTMLFGCNAMVVLVVYALQN